MALSSLFAVFSASLVIVISIVVYKYYTFDDILLLEFENHGKQLRTLRWPLLSNDENIRTFISAIIATKKPVVITHHPFFSNSDNIPLFITNDFTSYFNEYYSTVNVENDIHLALKTNDRCPIFEYFDSNLPLADILNWNTAHSQQPTNNNSYLKINALQEYFHHCELQSKHLTESYFNTNAGEYQMYSCSNISNFMEYAMLAFEIQPSTTNNISNPLMIDGLFHQHLHYFVPKNTKLQTLKFWFSSIFSITKLHFDVAHNFNLQIQGKKVSFSAF